jgi:hypothetical protein
LKAVLPERYLTFESNLRLKNVEDNSDWHAFFNSEDHLVAPHSLLETKGNLEKVDSDTAFFVKVKETTST